MTYPIERRIVAAIPKTKLKSKSYIIAHESGNANNTGDNSLEAEIKYMSNNWRNAFTQFWVGDKAIVQIAEDGYMAYGAGGFLNPHSPAQIELARVDTQAEFDESYKRYVWLLRYLADKHGIPKTLDSDSRTGIKTHDWVTRNLGGTTHTDPYGYLAKWGVSKAQFKKDVENGIYIPKEGEITVSSIDKEKHAKPSPALATEFALAEKAGITDGTYPNRVATRAEVAVMVYRAFAKQSDHMIK